MESWEKVQEQKKTLALSLADSMRRKQAQFDASIDQFERIIEASKEWDYDLHNKLTITCATWGSHVYISECKTKEVYENMLLCLTELYGEGTRDKDWSDNIRYSFTHKDEVRDVSVSVEFTVSTTMSGCVIKKKKVYVPQKVVDAHYTTKTVVECE